MDLRRVCIFQVYVSETLKFASDWDVRRKGVFFFGAKLIFLWSWTRSFAPLSVHLKVNLVRELVDL